MSSVFEDYVEAPQPPAIAPGMPAPDRDGLRIILKRMAGFTPKGLLAAPFLFHVPPSESFKHSHAHAHLDYDTLRGQFSRPAGRQLIQLAFTAMVLDWTPEWSLIHAPGWVPNPVEISEQLVEICEQGHPFLFTAGQPKLWGRYDILDLPMTLRSIDVDERAGESDARYLDVSFVEFRSPTLLNSKRKGKGKKRYNDKLPTYVTVLKDGSARDRNGHRFKAPVTLHKLAQHFYHSNAKWTLIAKRNGLRNYAPGRSLKDWAKRHRGIDKLQIPALPHDD